MLGKYILHEIRFNQKNPEKDYKINHVAEYKEHTIPLFDLLDDINLQVTALFMFRFFNNMLPEAFNDCLMLNKELHYYNTRSTACVHKNYARTNYSKHLVSYRGIDTLNNLPESLKEMKTFYSFRKY